MPLVQESQTSSPCQPGSCLHRLLVLLTGVPCRHIWGLQLEVAMDNLHQTPEEGKGHKQQKAAKQEVRAETVAKIRWKGGQEAIQDLGVMCSCVPPPHTLALAQHVNLIFPLLRTAAFRTHTNYNRGCNLKFPCYSERNMLTLFVKAIAWLVKISSETLWDCCQPLTRASSNPFPVFAYSYGFQYCHMNFHSLH